MTIGAWPYRQPHTCHIATGRLAAARLLTGDYDGVTARYAQLDLDPGLAPVGRIASLAQGLEAEAQGRASLARRGAVDAGGSTTAGDSARSGHSPRPTARCGSHPNPGKPGTRPQTPSARA